VCDDIPSMVNLITCKHRNNRSCIVQPKSFNRRTNVAMPQPPNSKYVGYISNCKRLYACNMYSSDIDAAPSETYLDGVPTNSRQR